ncbi:MAG: LVIVD repeat-containing protein [Saprospiraceae bacterium]
MKNTLLIITLLLSFTTTIFAQQITGTTGKIWYHEQVIYANIVDKGVLVIDNKNPKQPKKLGFIEIPGNVDIAVVDKILIANNFDDLITIDISKLDKISNKKILRRFDGIFPQHGTGSEKIDWIEPTKKQWKSSGTAMASSSNSVGGSMACLTIVGKQLYAINGEEIHSFNISNPKKVSQNKDVVKIKGDNIETIFSTDDKLFIGAQKGMYIYGLDNPKAPNLVGMYEHTESCDPVVVEGNRAYITLRDGTECNRKINRLEIIDISNPKRPKRISSTKTTHPYGLAVDCGYVYLCDGEAGLKVVDATNPRRPQLEQQLKEIQNTYDIIALQREKILILVGDGQLIQYNYTKKTDLKKLSKISINL